MQFRSEKPSEKLFGEIAEIIVAIIHLDSSF